MSDTAPESLLMAAISFSALLPPHWLATCLAAVNLAAVTVGADEEEHPALWGAAKALAEKRFRRRRHQRRAGLDSRGQLLAR